MATQRPLFHFLLATTTLLAPAFAIAQESSDLLKPRTLVLWALLIVVAFFVSRRRAMKAHEQARKDALKQEESASTEEDRLAK